MDGWIRETRIQRNCYAGFVSFVYAWMIESPAIPVEALTDRNKVTVSAKFGPILIFGDSTLEDTVENNEMRKIAAAALAKNDAVRSRANRERL